MLAAGSRINRYAFLTGLALAMGLAYMTCQAEEVERDVIYVPTPEPVVEKMLELAKPQKGEVLYDLGCGDGRIVVTAAKKYGVKGTGVDIDPERIAESNENAKSAGVTDKVKFIKGNLFEMDFKDADIIALYLLTDLNVKLRPKLLDTLKPGARIVSHAFTMGDWEPEEEVSVEPGGQDVYFWIIPAKVEGTWKTDNGSLELKQKYQMVTGTANIGGKKGEIKDGRLRGSELSFTLDGAKYTAKVDEGTMKGKAGDGGKEFTAKREGGAAKKEQAKEKATTR